MSYWGSSRQSTKGEVQIRWGSRVGGAGKSRGQGAKTSLSQAAESSSIQREQQEDSEQGLYMVTSGFYGDKEGRVGGFWRAWET